MAPKVVAERDHHPRILSRFLHDVNLGRHPNGIALEEDVPLLAVAEHIAERLQRDPISRLRVVALHEDEDVDDRLGVDAGNRR
jgi:hypothetical protein